MMLALLLSIVGAATPNTGAAVLSDDPPVQVWLNHDNYFQRGDKARVNVRLADDGYLLVLRADADGRVRVLFPLDPSDDAFVRGGETIEVRGRGDREAFFVDDREGSGLVLAARSVTPFKFDEFVRGDHWDYRVLSARDAGDDKEAALVDIVQRMTADGRFDYDDAKYVVASTRASYDSYYPSYSAVHIGVGWGWPYRYGSYYGSYYTTCYDPFYYDPFVCYDPFFYAPYRYGFTYGYGYGYRPYVYRPYGYGGYAFYNRPHNLFINRVRTGTGVRMSFKDQLGTNASVGGIGPRFRIPEGTAVARGRTGVAPRNRDAMRRNTADGPVSFPTHDRSVRARGEQPADRARPVDRPQPSDRPKPADRPRPADRPAPEPRRDPSSAGGGRSSGGSVSQPRSSGGGRSAPASHGGGGGGGNRGNSGGGRRRP
jgi:hypothetical protein